MLKLFNLNQLELAKLEQLAERMTFIQEVMGSIPDWILYTDFFSCVCVCYLTAGSGADSLPHKTGCVVLTFVLCVCVCV